MFNVGQKVECINADTWQAFGHLRVGGIYTIRHIDVQYGKERLHFHEIDSPMSNATFNQMLTLTYRLAQKDKQPLDSFTPHDFRRTASTLLHEAGYNTDWIEKCLAHEQKGVRAVYNKAEYKEQRAAMLQDWADMVDRFVSQE